MRTLHAIVILLICCATAVVVVHEVVRPKVVPLNKVIEVQPVDPIMDLPAETDTH